MANPLVQLDESHRLKTCGSVPRFERYSWVLFAQIAPKVQRFSGIISCLWAKASAIFVFNGRASPSLCKATGHQDIGWPIHRANTVKTFTPFKSRTRRFPAFIDAKITLSIALVRNRLFQGNWALRYQGRRLRAGAGAVWPG